VQTKEEKEVNMYRMKHPKKRSKKSSPFFAIVPSGETLVGILTSPKAVVDRFKKNKGDARKIYRVNNN